MEDVGKNMSDIMKRRNMNVRYQEMMANVLEDPDVKAFLEANQGELTQEDIEKSYPKLYEFVQEKRKFQLNDPTMLAPGYEPQLTLNFHYVDVTYVPTSATIELQKQEEIQNRIKSLDIPKDIRNATLKSVIRSEDRMELLLEVIDFINEYTENPQAFHKGLYIAGDMGIGKTYILGAMANELAKKGFTTNLVHFPALVSHVKSGINDNTVNQKMDIYKKANILVLDDVGAESMGTWVRDEVLGIILQYRMQEQLPTFFTSNMTMEDYEKHLANVTQTEELLKAKRIMERVRYLAKELILRGDNRRNPGE